jgi:hypothetical protein
MVVIAVKAARGRAGRREAREEGMLRLEGVSAFGEGDAEFREAAAYAVRFAANSSVGWCYGAVCAHGGGQVESVFCSKFEVSVDLRWDSDFALCECSVEEGMCGGGVGTAGEARVYG